MGGCSFDCSLGCFVWLFLICGDLLVLDWVFVAAYGWFIVFGVWVFVFSLGSLISVLLICWCGCLCLGWFW